MLRNAAVRGRVPGIGASILEVPEMYADRAIASLRATGLFRYVERDYYAHTAAEPNDPFFDLQWHLGRIELPLAWDITTGSSSVLMAVVDSGVDSTAPDLASRLVPGWNFVTNSADTSDVLGHGTAVAGILAALSNNGTGGAGVTWKGSILPLAVVNANDSAAYSNVAAAIEYAADSGARIINVSVGGANASFALQEAVDYAWNKGAIVFASAMNGGDSKPYYPAACNHAVAVSATDSSDRLASFSSYGNWVALSAPGAGILAPASGGGYGYWYGTSFAAPIAAGVAALALSVNPALSNTELLALVEESADDLGAPGFDDSFGWGRVNAYRTVIAAGGTPPVPAPEPTPPPGPTPPPTPPPAPAPAIAVSISPAAAKLRAGETQQFQASVTGSAAGVTWSVAPALGSISAAGLYTAPATLDSAAAVVVTATSVADPGKSASAEVTIAARPESRASRGGRKPVARRPR